VKSTVAPVGLALPGMQPELQPAELNIIAEEAPLRSVELAAGYGSYEDERGSALHRDSNLFGWGRTWELGGNLSQRSQGTHTRIIDHDLLGIQRIFSVILCGGWHQEPLFDRTSYASEFSLRAPLTDWLDLRTTYTLEAERASERAAVFDDSQDQGFVLNGVLNTSLLWDGRDDRQLPTRGGLADVGFGISDPALGACRE
jgi:outer membrane protein assembly factor BamA